jgi:hypothetical protein
VRGQAEAVGLIVMAAMLIAAIYLSTAIFQRASATFGQASQLAQLLSERAGEEVYFMVSNGTIYARPSISTRVKEILVYNSTGVVEHIVTDIYLAPGNWTPLPLTSVTVGKIASGEAVLLVLTERDNLVAWDPYAEYSELSSLTSGATVEDYSRSMGYKVLGGRTSDPASLLSSGPHLCEIDLSGRYVPNVYEPCNAFAQYITSDKLVVYLSFFTYSYNKTHWWFDSNGYLNLNATWFWSYAQSPGLVPPYAFLQVTRLVGAGGSASLTFYVDVRFNTTDISLRSYGGVAIVAYVLPSNTDLKSMVALAQPGIPATLWVKRVLIAYYPMSSLPYYTQQVGGTTWYVIYHNGTYSVAVNTSELGLSEYVVAYGVEIVQWYTNMYPRVKVELLGVQRV